MLVWTREESRLTFALDTDVGPASGVARLRPGQGILELPEVKLAWGDSRLRGAARVKNVDVVASLDELLLQPRLVHSLWPALDPVRALRVQGAFAGPLHALNLRLLATAGASTVGVRGQVDLHSRSFRLLAALDTFELQSLHRKRSSRLTLEVFSQGRLVAGGVAGTVAVHHVWGTVEGLPLRGGLLEAKLNGPEFHVDKVLLDLPGGVFDASGGGTWRDFRVRYGVVITDSLELRRVPAPLRVLVGVTQIFPGRAVNGSIRRRDGGKIGVTYKIVPPTLRWAELLYHVMIGRAPRLSVRY
jgi:hypothetical protein